MSKSYKSTEGINLKRDRIAQNGQREVKRFTKFSVKDESASALQKNTSRGRCSV